MIWTNKVKLNQTPQKSLFKYHSCSVYTTQQDNPKSPRGKPQRQSGTNRESELGRQKKREGRSEMGLEKKREGVRSCLFHTAVGFMGRTSRRGRA